MQTPEKTSDHGRILAAEDSLRRNATLARQIARDIASTLRDTAPELPFRPEVFYRKRTSEQDFDVRYHVGVARTFRAGLFRKQRYKVLQIHIEGNIRSAVARISVPDGHPFGEGIALYNQDEAARIFSRKFLTGVLSDQADTADHAYAIWKSERPPLLPIGSWK